MEMGRGGEGVGSSERSKRKHKAGKQGEGKRGKRVGIME